MVSEQQNLKEAVYVPIDERQERIAALIKLAISDPEGILRALDRDQAKRV